MQRTIITPAAHMMLVVAKALLIWISSLRHPGAEVIHLGNQHDQQGEARPPAFSDDALALRFIDQHKDALRYVPSLGKWLRWDGKRWCFDDRLIAYDRMRKVCRAASAECNQPKLAKLVASNKTAAAAERFARPANYRHGGRVGR